MIRIDPHTVELTPVEFAASDYFDELLDRGYGIHDAVDKIKVEVIGLSPEFLEYLRT